MDMAKKSGNILIVDDDEDVLYSARLLLKQFYSIVHIEKDPELIPNLISNSNYDVILLDMNFSGDRNSGKQGEVRQDLKVLNSRSECMQH